MFYNIKSKLSAKYWTSHNVTTHKKFKTRDESIEYFNWRNIQYPGYINLLPVTGFDGKSIVDFGCGPGHDLVGFSEFSNPSSLIGVDVSSTSLAEAGQRLKLHRKSVELIKIEAEDACLPIEDNSIDYIHCSGVLMHLKSPVQVLSEFFRVLKDDGSIRLMVYNHDSLWLHLYVAHVLKGADVRYARLSIEEAFARSTDGFDCPISGKWTPDEMTDLSSQVGFSCRHLGNAVSLFELSLLPQRFSALMNPEFPPEHRNFLASLTFDQQGIPYFKGNVAGIDGCYELKKI